VSELWGFKTAYEQDSSGFVESCLTENKVGYSIDYSCLVKFRVDNKGGDGIGCFALKSR